jgi:hypothetical protein
MDEDDPVVVDEPPDDVEPDVDPPVEPDPGTDPVVEPVPLDPDPDPLLSIDMLKLYSKYSPVGT